MLYLPNHIIKSFRHAYKYNPVVRLVTLVLALRLSALPKVLHNSFNMYTGGFPDMYARSPQTLGMHIKQITCAHVTTIL